MPRPIRQQTKIRLNLEIPERSKKQLDVLVERTDANSMSEVFRRAIALYDLLTMEKELGSTTVIRSQDGSEKFVEFL